MKTSTPFQISLVAMALAAGTCYAEGDIFKCTVGHSVSFQSTPCEVGAVSTKILSAKHDQKGEIDEDDDGAPAVKTPPPVRNNYRLNLYSRTDRLQAGMSDLQILNNRRWGKPQRISRSREASVGWHEYWTYQTGANGGKQLHFVNGILAEVDDIEPVVVEKPSMVSLMINSD